MAIEIRPVDPFDDASVDAWWDIYSAARRTDRGDDAILWSLEETRTELQQESAVTERRAFLAHRAGAVVGAAALALPLKDNLHLADIAVYVAAPDRRQGVGSALLAALEERAAGRTRRTVTGATMWPATAPADGAGQPGPEFARRHGYQIALGDLESVLDLPVAEELLSRLAAETPEDGYAVRSWVGPVPDDLVMAMGDARQRT